MTHVPYLVAGYGITAAALAAYAGWLVARGRALARQLPPEELYWAGRATLVSRPEEIPIYDRVFFGGADDPAPPPRPAIGGTGSLWWTGVGKNHFHKPGTDVLIEPKVYAGLYFLLNSK